MPSGRWMTVGKAVALVAALGFVFSVQYVPHLDTFDNPPPGDEPGLMQLGQAWINYLQGFREGSPWAVHVDEHFHASIISEVQRLDRLIPWDVYAEDPAEFTALGSLRGAVHERGYHLLMAQSQELTGISTYRLYQFLPAAWMAFTAFAVYALVRPHPAAVPSAAFVGLLPTTIRFLGPGFLVPIGFSLAWIPAAAILTTPAKRKAPAALLLLLVTAWAFFVHLVAGFVAVALILGTALFSAKRYRRSALTLFLLALVPVAWLYRSFSGGIQDEVAREATLPIDFTIFDNFGVISLFIWALGIGIYWLDPPPDDDQRPAVTAFAALSLVSFALIVSSVVFDLNRYATYSRMHPIFFLTGAVGAGYGVTVLSRRAGQLVHRALPMLQRRMATRETPWVGTLLAVLLALSLTGVATSQAVSHHLGEGYYRVMTDETWESYNSVRASEPTSGPAYEVFLSHPWRAPFLFEMTGKTPHTVMTPGAPPAKGEDWLAYLQSQDDLAFYVMNDITLVVGPREPPGGVFVEEGPRVWKMQEPYAEQIQRIREGKPLDVSALPAR